MNPKVVTIIGLIRDFIAAFLGLLILFGVDLSDEQVAGVLLVVSTGLALASWAYTAYKSTQVAAVETPAVPVADPLPKPRKR